MKTMKKFLSLALILCMVLSCAVVAFAEEGAAITLKILSLPEIRAGAPIAETSVEYALSEGYVAEPVWLVWGVEHDEDFGDTETYIPAEGNFDTQSVYYLQLKITAEEGYTMTEDITVESDADYIGYYTEYDDEGNVISLYVDVGVFTLTTVIDRVEIVFNEVKAGNTPGLESIKLYSGEEELPAESAALTAVWFSLLDNYEEITGAFEENKVYQVQAELRAAAGYSFADYTTVYLNGEDGTGFNYPTYLDIFMDYSLREPIHSFEISGMPQFKEGVAFRDTLVLESEYEDCDLFVYWMDEAWEEVEEDAFIAGKTYIVQLEANSYGYELLGEDFVFVIDGVTYAPSSLGQWDAYMELEICVPAAAEPDMPPTGDAFPLLLWAALAMVSMMSVAVLVKTKH